MNSTSGEREHKEVEADLDSAGDPNETSQQHLARPTAEACAKHLSAIFNSMSVAAAPKEVNQDATPHKCLNEVQVGSGKDAFEVKICIEKCYD